MDKFIKVNLADDTSVYISTQYIVSVEDVAPKSIDKVKSHIHTVCGIYKVEQSIEEINDLLDEHLFYRQRF